jgi:amino acid adenylation domain-containing protein
MGNQDLRYHGRMVRHASPPFQGTNAPQYLCIQHLLEGRAKRAPAAIAITAPGRAPLTYGRLHAHVDNMVQTLHAMGLGRHDRIALVLPNGPELAVALLTVAAAATCAPLNVAYSDEFDMYFADLQAQALIIQADLDSPARAVAQRHGIRVIELSPMPEAEAGIFALAGEAQICACRQELSQPQDVALLLHTSGTMSQPKIVPLTHTNICTSAYNTSIALELTESDRCLNVMPLFHPHGLMGALLASLVSGASIVCTPGLHMPQFFDWMAEFHPTWYTAVPTIHQTVLMHVTSHREIIASCPLRFIRSGSASLLPQVLIELESVFHAPVIEYYGMTETSSQITSNPLPPGERKIRSVGVSTGPEIAIMDVGGTLLAAGETGEIVVCGETIFQGYENDRTADKEAFTHGWFRTGDQGYLDSDGYLFITGRLKETINRGGTKVSPQEVDDILIQHPAVAQAATFPMPHTRWGEDVATAVVLRCKTSATEQELRRFVAARLAAFKVPSQVLIVEALPMGPTGKLQRRCLAEQFGLIGPGQDQPALHATYAAPRTPIEAALAGIWAMVLGLERVGVNDSFFRLGGDSLLATQLLLRIREVTHVDVDFRSFFETPTIAEIARLIATVHQASLRTSGLPLRPSARDGPLSLSYAQQRLWFLEQLGHSQHAYHLLEAMRLRGPLQVKALLQSLQEIVKRHEVLRTTFTNVAGQPLQVIGQATRLPVSEVDLRALSQHEQEAQVHILAQTEAQRPFDLAQGPLMRVSLVRLTDEEHVLLLTMHHLVSDGWSQGVFWREFAIFYGAFTTGRPLSLPPLSIQYADFASWQQQWLRGEVLDTPLAYWKSHLAGVSTLQLPTDHPRPAVATSQGAHHWLILSPTLTHALKALSQRHGVTLFMTLLAAFQTLLHRYTWQDDIAVGTLIANRNRVELEGLIGFFVNTLVLRTDLSGDPSFRALLDRVRAVTLCAFEHQEVPYEKLLETLRLPRDLSRNPLFQVMCILHNTPQQAPALPGLTVEPLEIDPGTARFDVTLEFWETPEGLRCRFEYSTALFEAATITRMGSHLQTLLEGIAADPEQRVSRLPLLTAEERQRLLVEWNATRAPYPTDRCLHHMFEAQVRYTPDAVAVVCGDESLTYGELNRRANQIAHYLLWMGVGPNKLVGLCMERSLAMVVGLLGILKAGAAYLPLDPMYPPERLAFIVGDAQPPVVLTQERLLGSLPAHGAQLVCLDSAWAAIAQCHDNDPVIGASADDMAYLLYTSGSTGNPKGVVGIHSATLNALAWMWRTFPFADDEVCCQKTSISFGDSIQEWLGPLLGGMRLVLIPDEVLKDLPRFVQTLALHRVTRLIIVPSLLRTLLDTYHDLPARLPNLKLWFAGGEALSSDLVLRFRQCLPHSRLINLYGASEASDDTTWYDTSLMSSELLHVPIGRPIANTHLYVLDQHLQPVPMGIAGELYVGGAGLTRGYFQRPELTAERFVPHPFGHESGARLYKTGDLVRYRSDGNLEYIGRDDQLVKLRGVLIELEEIEAVLREQPAVRETAVIIREDIPGDRRLVAYVVPAQEPAPTIRELRRFLEQKLPTAMVPAAFVMLERFPLTPSGKVDRRVLPPPGLLRPALEDLYVLPRTPIEQRLAAIWCELLGLEQVGIHDNFFELGGHSLLAMKLLFRVHDTTHVEVPLSSFFEMPTVAHVAAIIERAGQTEQDLQASPIVPIPREGTLPASIAQEHFWLFDQLLPGLPLFHISSLVRLQGALNVTHLEQSFNEVIRRHEALRTTFATMDGRLVQVSAATGHMHLVVTDLRTLPEAEREGEARRLAQKERQRAFDLTQGPLWRGCLLRLGDQDHFLLVALHHIISDGWSLGILVHELASLYDAFATGVPSPLPALPIQYADFAFWQRQWRQHAEMQAQLDYWRAQLRDPLPALALPTDHPRGTALHLRTARQPLALPGRLVQALKERSRQEGSTLFMTCLTAFKMLLYGYTGQEDLCVATLVANRTRPETEDLIGLFVNTVILRTDLGGDPTCRQVLQRVRATTLAAYAHQDLPFEELVRTLERERHLDRASLCRVMVIWQNFTLRPLQCSAQTLSFQTIEQGMVTPEEAVTTFDIVLTLRESPQGVTGTCLYKTDLFEATTISRMLDDFQSVLACLSAQPQQALATFRALHLSGKRG